MHYLPTATSTSLSWQDNGRHDRLKTNNGRRQPLPPYLNKKGFYYYFWPKKRKKSVEKFLSFFKKLKQFLMDESFKVIICYRCGTLFLPRTLKHQKNDLLIVPCEPTIDLALNLACINMRKKIWKIKISLHLNMLLIWEERQKICNTLLLDLREKIQHKVYTVKSKLLPCINLS